jgi:DNA-directed RNA polymerase specialized sigma24 family protein
MTRSQIIEELYNSKEIKQALMKMQPANLREELKQEMFVNLCSISEDKFWAIYNNNGTSGLKYWLVRCMLNMIYSTGMNQPFFRHFRAKFESIDDIHELVQIEDESKDYKEKLFNRVEVARKELSWYEDMLLDTYVELNFNQTEISRKTGIPYMSIVKTISNIKKKIRDEA